MAPQLRPPPARFSLHRRGDGTVVCRVSGQIDADSRIALREAFGHALGLAVPRTTLAVDLSGLGFCDSTGLNGLLRLRAAAVVEQVRLVLCGPRPQFTRLLEITGADALWTVRPSLGLALQADPSEMPPQPRSDRPGDTRG